MFKKREEAFFQHKFEPGDLVMLKSRGAAMTVSFELAAGESSMMGPGVNCFWHDKMGVPQSAYYDSDLLWKVTDEVVKKND